MLGGIGIGLVWGWLIGGLTDVAQNKLRNILSVVMGTILLGVETSLIESRRGFVPFLMTAILASWLSILWRSFLRSRFATPT